MHSPQIRGSPVELLLSCTHMNDYGEDAASLKKALDDVVRSYVDEATYQDLLVSVCCDGAAVNMGNYRGIERCLMYLIEQLAQSHA